jgi:hypothetical protein
VKQTIVACITLSLLCACGGGGGSSPGTTISVPPPIQTSSSAQTATLTLRWTIGPSSNAKKPNYISGNAAQLLVLINTVNGSTTLPANVPRSTTIALTTTGSSPDCTITGTTESCAAQIPAPPGSVNYTFNLEDANGNVLSTATQTFTIVAGTSNPSLMVSLGGVVATVTVSVTGKVSLIPSLTAPASITLNVTAEDASGYTISGSTPYNNPVTLTTSDASNATELSVNGGSPANPVILTAPTDSVSLTYTGEATSNATITASGTGVSGGGTIPAEPGTITLLSGTALDSAANGGLATDPNFNQPTVFFSSTGVQQTVTATETGWTNPFDQTLVVALDSSYCGSGASAIASVASNTTSAGTDAIVFNGNNVGFCEVTLSDGLLASTTLWVTVTTGSLQVNSRPRVPR